jgi:hypothetical protein
MQNISSFLTKFKNIIKSDEDIKEKICLSIKNNTGIEINKSNILIRNKIATIKEKPHFKNEVFMKKEKILDELKGVISDIA